MKKRFRAESDCQQCDRLSRRNSELEQQLRSLKKQLRKFTQRVADLEVENTEIALELEEEFKRMEAEAEIAEEKVNKLVLARPDGKIVELTPPPQKLTYSHYKGIRAS